MAAHRKYFTKQEYLDAARERGRLWRLENRPSAAPFRGAAKIIPETVLQDRAARALAEMHKSPTQVFFGDPAPGFSALDQKNGRHPS